VAVSPRTAPAGRPAPDGAPAGGSAPGGGRWTWLLGNPLCAPAVDVLIVLGVLVWGLAASRWGDAPGGNRSWGYLFDVLLSLALLARRRHPLLVFLAVSMVGMGEWLADTPVSANVALLVALYSVGAHPVSRRASVLPVVALVTEIGVVSAALRWAPPNHLLAALLLLTGTALGSLTLGVYVRTRRDYLSARLERVRTAERDRDQRALLAAAEERRRIARELHDIVAHSIAVMVWLSDGAAATEMIAPPQSRRAPYRPASSRAGCGPVQPRPGTWMVASSTAGLACGPRRAAHRVTVAGLGGAFEPAGQHAARRPAHCRATTPAHIVFSSPGPCGRRIQGPTSREKGRA